MKSTTAHQTIRGGAGCLILLFAMCTTAYAFWKMGYAAGTTDLHDPLFQTQWTSEAQMNIHAFEEQINAYRISKKVKPLGSSSVLEKTARDSAIAIFSGERGWDHNQFEASVSGQY